MKGSGCNMTPGLLFLKTFALLKMLILAYRRYATQSKYVNKNRETETNEVLYGSSLVTVLAAGTSCRCAEVFVVERDRKSGQCRKVADNGSSTVEDTSPTPFPGPFRSLDPALSDARNKTIPSLYHLPRHQQIYPCFF